MPHVVGKEMFGVRISSGSTESCTSGGNVEVSRSCFMTLDSTLLTLPAAPDESHPPQLVSGGACRITKEEHERLEREAKREAAGTYPILFTILVWFIILISPARISSTARAPGARRTRKSPGG
jgi:hypothetical protein